MGRTTRPLAALSSIDHLSVDSQQHRRDLVAGKKAKQALEESGGHLVYVLPHKSRISRSFPGLSKGFTAIPGNPRASTKEFREHIRKEAQARKSYRRPMKDKRYKEKRRGVRRIVKYPIVTHMQSCPPQMSDAIEELCRRGKPLQAEMFFLEWCEKNARTIEQVTGCEVVAKAGHLDTDNPHADFPLSRYSKDETILVLNGIGAWGPYLSGLDRLISMGSKEPDLVEKWSKALWKCSSRCASRVRKKKESNAIPTDILVARKVDAWVDEKLTKMGFDVPELKRSYLERARGTKLQRLQRESEELENRHRIVQQEIKAIQDALNTALETSEAPDEEMAGEPTEQDNEHAQKTESSEPNR